MGATRLKVLLCPADLTGCGHFRLLYPGLVLKQQGQIEVTVTQQLPLRIAPGQPPQVVAAGPIDADVIVLQRPLLRVLADAIPLLQRNGHTVVVDIDDDFTSLHPRHPLRRQVNPASSPDLNVRHLQRACATADVVTVSTPALADRYGAHGNAIVLRNRIPAFFLTLEAERDGRTIGWPGFTVYHPGDLTVTHGGIQQALQDTGARFLNVGNGENVKRELALHHEPDATGAVKFADYPAAIAQLDVGIAPLQDNAFNRAKSWLKPLELAAAGVPPIVSPLPEYQLLAEQGIGLVAKDRARDWARHATRLLSDEIYRAELADQGRAIVAEHHTYETNAWRWVEAWATARDRMAVAA